MRARIIKTDAVIHTLLLILVFERPPVGIPLQIQVVLRHIKHPQERLAVLLVCELEHLCFCNRVVTRELAQHRKEIRSTIPLCRLDRSTVLAALVMVGGLYRLGGDEALMFSSAITGRRQQASEEHTKVTVQ